MFLLMFLRSDDGAGFGVAEARLTTEFLGTTGADAFRAIGRIAARESTKCTSLIARLNQAHLML
jgi:hypothetical protein